MTIHYSVESLPTLFLSEKFVSDKNDYLKQRSLELQPLHDFLNSIEINKQYFRTGIHVKNPKYKKKVSDDTLIIKQLKASLNKMSGLNYENLCLQICKDIETKQHLYPLLLQYIFEQSLLHHNYCKYYARLIELLHQKFNNISLLNKHIDDCYQTIVREQINEGSEYSALCSKNKQVDQLIGFGIFISELEMKGVIQDRIHKSIQAILDKMNTSLSEDELYKCVVCLYTIFKVIFVGKEIDQVYIDNLTEIKDKIKFMKIKFKIMDILERR